MLSTKLKEAAGNSADATLYVDDVFSTYLYAGNSTARSITNGIDLSTNGGMVWFKARNVGSNHYQVDTARGNTKYLMSNVELGQQTFTDALTAFNTTGFNLGVDAAAGDINGTGYNMASWTFRKAAKFFDVVTYTGTGSARTIAHSLGVAPGMIIVKRTNATAAWRVYSNGMTSAEYSMQLSYLSGQASTPTVWDSTAPTSSVFTVGTAATVNDSGQTYVAYLFAHDTSADGIIQCGSYTGNGSATGTTVSLGWEPQYLMVKNASGTGNWQILDSMRGMPVGSADATLQANLANAESSVEYLSPTATGFQITSTSTEVNTSGSTYIYMAIRRPNKPPTSGTQVFSPQIWTGNATARTITGTNNPVDLSIVTVRDSSGSGGDRLWNDRLRGAYQTLYSNYTQAEATQSNYITGFDVQYGEKIGTAASVNGSSITYVAEMFSRAPGFFDEVCYTGNGAGSNAKTHNLTVAPELLIIKNRSSSGSGDWFTFHTFTVSNFKKQLLDTTDAQTNYSYGSFLDAQPSSTTFTVNSGAGCNESGTTYVAYLFATLAGISKVGSYTGNGSTQNINCGFAAGARFIMIKATSTTGNWIVFDSARGIVAGNDPFFYINNQDAETTNQDAIDPYSAGFTVNTTNVNDSGVSYIFLAVA